MRLWCVLNIRLYLSIYVLLSTVWSVYIGWGELTKVQRSDHNIPFRFSFWMNAVFPFKSSTLHSKYVRCTYIYIERIVTCLKISVVEPPTSLFLSLSQRDTEWKSEKSTWTFQISSHHLVSAYIFILIVICPKMFFFVEYTVQNTRAQNAEATHDVIDDNIVLYEKRTAPYHFTCAHSVWYVWCQCRG